jgi:hypothetical protein
VSEVQSLLKCIFFLGIKGILMFIIVDIFYLRVFYMHEMVLRVLLKVSHISFKLRA